MASDEKAKESHREPWQPSGGEVGQIPLHEDSPPAYHTMYPGVAPRPSLIPPKETCIDTDNLAGGEMEAQKNTQKDMWVKLKGEKHGDLQGDQKPAEDKQKKLEVKTPIIVFSKEAKERLLKKTHGARDTLSDFCRKTTAHGFHHVIEEDLPLFLRIFWLVVTLISLGILLSVAYTMTKASFVTKRPITEVTYKDSRKDGLPFPEFTVCSRSGFWKSKIEKHNVSTSLASYLLLAVGGPDVVSNTLKTDKRMVRVFQHELTSFLKNRNLTLSQMITLLSPTCEEVIVGCFNEVESISGKTCCETMFRPTITTLGMCYSTLTRTRPDQPIRQTTAGLIGGTRIIFSINLNEYMEYDPNVLATTALAEVGIHVSLSHFDMTPTVASNMHAVRIAPDTSANIALSVTRIDHQERYLRDWPWSSEHPSCVKEEEYLHLTEARKMYTENNLYFTLMYRHCLLLHANCSAIPMRLTDDETAECMPDKILHHLFLLTDEQVRNCVLTNLNQSENSSNKLCYTTFLTKQLSYTTLKKDSLQDLRQSPNNSLSMAVVYYSELGYREYYERIPTFSTWFSDLGGQMGLFLGASFITLVELSFTACYVVRLVVWRAVRAVHARLKAAMTMF
ncbi:acid-sensing ion channel 2-like [Eriocheir sinensis]|uniref:acid-sensing ion channel 2-like n=1 Tax=Eriocheir sinensis TaxID=95602 RepID=UPI0021C6759D|nr:acid-sensing ion channel 2-like [Eriocheir sinensis]